MNTNTLQSVILTQNMYMYVLCMSQLCIKRMSYSFIIEVCSGSVLQLESSQTVVDIELYDTSGHVDCLINSVLVEAGVAQSTRLGMYVLEYYYSKYI